MLGDFLLGCVVGSDLVDISVVLKHETDGAYLVDHGGKEPVWVPKSACALEKVKGKLLWELTLPEWLATEKGLI